jgi:hypothetical protein
MTTLADGLKAVNTYPVRPAKDSNAALYKRRAALLRKKWAQSHTF